ncbi:hypothetical protein NsoK4_03370 [Nitrosopumilus sp. K4]|uniref:hypothetical protein n=1 Tax=Nitrosopumilus sp. K4 TaxID=2795383 RepID=UPI001BA76BB3|nr:hypothetical protein [Nitrosopumilus sp. K4]QUC65299.1 hypothetical protein NsoK4_03370 [Nitrosopumilus sp. K4]
MSKLGPIDLEILFLGINRDGRFNEENIENSSLKRLGVGRILDSLASLKDRKLIDLNKDGSFSITDLARHSLWDNKMPLWVKVLKLLEVKSFTTEDIAKYLKIQEEKIDIEIENLRKNQMVLMAPQRVDERIVKSYEILPEGIEKLRIVEKEGVEKHQLGNNAKPQVEILAIINQVIKDINDSEITLEKKESITSKLSQIKEKLEI